MNHDSEQLRIALLLKIHVFGLTCVGFYHLKKFIFKTIYIFFENMHLKMQYKIYNKKDKYMFNLCLNLHVKLLF